MALSPRTQDKDRYMTFMAHQQPWSFSVQLTLYHTIPTLNDPEKETFRKRTLWEKENMLVTSVFSLSHNVFYQSKIEILFLNNIFFVVCKCFEF